MYQTLEFVRTLIKMYVDKHCSTQTHTLRVSMDTVEQAMRFAMTELKVETLKDKQKEAICSFVNGRDCFVILPTGYGKTLCYVLLPYVYDHLRGKTRSSIVICVSPLTDTGSIPSL